MRCSTCEHGLDYSGTCKQYSRPARFLFNSFPFVLQECLDCLRGFLWFVFICFARVDRTAAALASMAGRSRDVSMGGRSRDMSMGGRSRDMSMAGPNNATVPELCPSLSMHPCMGTRHRTSMQQQCTHHCTSMQQQCTRHRARMQQQCARHCMCTHECTHQCTSRHWCKQWGRQSRRRAANAHAMSL